MTKYVNKCTGWIHTRPLKDATSLSLNTHPECSLDLREPRDLFLVYLYQSVVKLNCADAPNMLIRFMFWICAQESLKKKEKNKKKKPKSSLLRPTLRIDLLSGPDQGSPVRIHVTRQCRNREVGVCVSVAQTDHSTWLGKRRAWLCS